jgi:phosphate-selective porin
VRPGFGIRERSDTLSRPRGPQSWRARTPFHAAPLATTCAEVHVSRFALKGLLSSLLALPILTTGCATGSGLFGSSPSPAAPAEQSADVDERLARMEAEIAALRQERAEAASAAPAPAPSAQAAAPAPVSAAPAASSPVEKLLGPWQLTEDITFKPGLRVQGRYVHDGATNNNDLAIQRFRMKGSGNAWKAKYAIEMKIDGTGRTGANPNAAVENAWLDYAFVPDLIGRAGLYDVPFSRDALTSDSKLLFMDRSLIKESLTDFGLADNGIGTMARGRPCGGRFEYAVGAFNNDRFGGLGTSGKSSNWVMPVGRIAVDLLDPAPEGGYADYKGSYIGKGRRLSIGANGELLPDAESGLREFSLYAWGTDVFFNWGPYTLQGEWDWYRLTGDVGKTRHGFYIQGGYLLEPLNRAMAERAPWFPDLELAARYQGVNPLNATSFLSNPKERRTSIGMNAYIHDHNLKVQTDFSWRQIQHEADGKLYQIQLQLDF